VKAGIFEILQEKEKKRATRARTSRGGGMGSGEKNAARRIERRKIFPGIQKGQIPKKKKDPGRSGRKSLRGEQGGNGHGCLHHLSQDLRSRQKLERRQVRGKPPTVWSPPIPLKKGLKWKKRRIHRKEMKGKLEGREPLHRISQMNTTW